MSEDLLLHVLQMYRCLFAVSVVGLFLQHCLFRSKVKSLLAACWLNFNVDSHHRQAAKALITAIGAMVMFVVNIRHQGKMSVRNSCKDGIVYMCLIVSRLSFVFIMKSVGEGWGFGHAPSFFPLFLFPSGPPPLILFIFRWKQAFSVWLFTYWRSARLGTAMSAGGWGRECQHRPAVTRASMEQCYSSH